MVLERYLAALIAGIKPPPAVTTPRMMLDGIPPIATASVLSDRQHVLTQANPILGLGSDWGMQMRLIPRQSHFFGGQQA